MAEKNYEEFRISPDTVRTWEDYAESVVRGTDAFDDFVESFTRFVAEQEDFGEDTRRDLEIYIRKLSDLKNSWDLVNQKIRESARANRQYYGSLEDIRNLSQEWSTDLSSGIRRTINDQLNLSKGVTRLAVENLAVLQKSNGISMKDFDRLDKRYQVLNQQWKSRQARLAPDGDLEAAKQREESAKREVERQLRSLLNKKKLTEAERSRIKLLREERDLHEQNIVVLDKYHNEAFEGLGKKIEKQREWLKEIQAGRDGLISLDKAAGAVKILNKLGLRSAAGELKEKVAADYQTKINLKLAAEDTRGLYNDAVLERENLPEKVKNAGRITPQELQERRDEESKLEAEINEIALRKSLREKELQEAERGFQKESSVLDRLEKQLAKKKNLNPKNRSNLVGKIIAAKKERWWYGIAKEDKAEQLGI